MLKEFSDELECVAGLSVYSIWKNINKNDNEDLITEEGITNLIDFFEFAISKNVIVEYDEKKELPIFSEDSPRVVAERIFCDIWKKNPGIPQVNPTDSDDFIAYLVYKTGWATLVHGTAIVPPQI
ncbi:hypothetical protein HLH26_14690 [Gluconacetobacter sp. 1b LMG 1731]|uniref:Uncharacterized protein n=1 Tax=Gluconacetobacter dulcium TaxID=2729096 RepID=A0A7W4IMR0_9PROT|nr:hypothetical protein [Gluconacetobacter dulcium]MBB2165759.1 hypothetical protein [Gluconacetobacter dulcium]MBB2194816.1 hypothetical protein [Gluconacetobacter dulcium]